MSIAIPVVGSATWLPLDTINITRIQLSTKGGVNMFDTDFLDHYYKIFSKKETKQTDLQGTDLIRVMTPSDNLTTAVAATRHDNTASDMNYLETAYLANGGIDSALTKDYLFRLGDIVNSIFAIDKGLVFPDRLILKIFWTPGNRFGWTSTSATNPTAGTAAALTAVTTLTGLSLYLAAENNPQIEQELRAKLSSGYQLTIPYIWPNKTNLSGTSQSVTLRFNNTQGKTIQKILHSVFHNTESTNTLFAHDNINGSKVTTYYTLLNNRKQQEFSPDCVNSTNKDDYMLHLPQLKGSCYMSKNIYAYNWFHCDDYSGLRLADEKTQDLNVISGIPLTGTDLQWSIYMTTVNAAYNHYSFGITQRTLMITSNKVEIM
jgi:hypothetical protein